MNQVKELLESPLAAYGAGLALIGGGRSTYWDIATHVGIHRPGAHLPQGDVR